MKNLKYNRNSIDFYEKYLKYFIFLINWEYVGGIRWNFNPKYDIIYAITCENFIKFESLFQKLF